jgi:hypothetical protein
MVLHPGAGYRDADMGALQRAMSPTVWASRTGFAPRGARSAIVPHDGTGVHEAVQRRPLPRAQPRCISKGEAIRGGLSDHIRVNVALRAPRIFIRRSTWPAPSSYAPTASWRSFRRASNAWCGSSSGSPRPRSRRAVLHSWLRLPCRLRQFRRLTPAEQQEHRRQGLCFNCDEPYVRGHQCKRLFYLESSDFDMEEDGAVDPAPNAKPDDDMPPQDVTVATACVVSLHALAGICTENTMIMLVVLKGACFLALLDTGSTHNFLQGAAMTRLGLTPLNGDQLWVTVANGDHLWCTGIARRMPISIAGDEYTITCIDIDLGCFNFILGVDFLRTLGEITWNLETMMLAFQRDARRIVWNGVQGKEATCTMTPTAAVAVAESQQPLLDRLLQQHSSIFEEPRSLPPARPYDHRIHLLPGTAPVAVRRYRYP